MPKPIFWATLSAELPETPDYLSFRGDFFIEGLEGGSMIWVVERAEGLYGFSPLNSEFYEENVKHLVHEGAEFDYGYANQFFARGTIVRIEGTD